MPHNEKEISDYLNKINALVRTSVGRSVVLVGPDSTSGRITVVMLREDPAFLQSLLREVPADALDVRVEPGWEAYSMTPRADD